MSTVASHVLAAVTAFLAGWLLRPRFDRLKALMDAALDELDSDDGGAIGRDKAAAAREARQP